MTFRWTRARYRRANHLHRLLLAIPSPGGMPAIVRRYLDLWEQQPSREDPLRLDIWYRMRAWKTRMDPSYDDLPF